MHTPLHTSNPHPNHSRLLQFRTPAVRHLLWICHAPQLINSHHVFDVASHLPDNYIAILQRWDNNPAAGPEVLTAPPHYRLGHYFESLYACLLQDLLGWNILARNLQIRVAGMTLGELDFVVQNPQTQKIEHHEIAIKFYLGYGGSDGLPPGWYGPNPRDRLDIKTARLLQLQSQRIHQPATADVLAQHGIALPTHSRVFMPGYLFYPLPAVPHPASQRPVLPNNVPSDHSQGQWLYLDNVATAASHTWVPLKKPHWLGPWCQPAAPDNNATQQTLDEISTTNSPRLFAALQHDAEHNLWIETERVFVVPPHWPHSQ